MGGSVPGRASGPAVDVGDLARFEVFWRDEVAAAGLYRDLAGLVDGDRGSLLLDLAATEERHAGHWAALLEGEGRELVAPSRPWRHRVLLMVARRFGVERVLPAVIRAEAADWDRYRGSAHAAPGMAEEETAHGRALALASTDNVGEGLALADARHRTSAGGSLRAAVFGANDGLVSNFALIMGVAGATGDPGVSSCSPGSRGWSPASWSLAAPDQTSWPRC
jgi:vacuolar iron transporter family protein